MLVPANPVISPSVVETGKMFYLSIAVTEVATTWEDLMDEVSNWGNLMNRYVNWKQVKQR